MRKLKCLLPLFIFIGLFTPISAHDFTNQPWIFLDNNPAVINYFSVTSNSAIQSPEKIIEIKATNEQFLKIDENVVTTALSIARLNCNWIIDKATINNCDLSIKELKNGFNYLVVELRHENVVYYKDSFGIILNAELMPAGTINAEVNETEITLRNENPLPETNYYWYLNNFFYQDELKIELINYAGKQIAYLVGEANGNKTFTEYKFTGLRKVSTPSPNLEKINTIAPSNYTPLILLSLGFAGSIGIGIFLLKSGYLVKDNQNSV